MKPSDFNKVKIGSLIATCDDRDPFKQVKDIIYLYKPIYWPDKLFYKLFSIKTYFWLYDHWPINKMIDLRLTFEDGYECNATHCCDLIGPFNI